MRKLSLNKFFKLPKLSNAGNSLIELMIAMAITSISSLALVYGMSESVRLYNVSSHKNAIISKRSEVFDILQDPVAVENLMNDPASTFECYRLGYPCVSGNTFLKDHNNQLVNF